MTIARVIEGRGQTIIHCGPNDDVRHAANLLAEKRIGALPVLDNGVVAGIFSERDLLYCIAELGAAALDKPIREVMTAPPITIDVEEKALVAMELMTQRRIRHLPVIREGRMVAFISIGDLVKFRIDSIEREAQHMREYIRTA